MNDPDECTSSFLGGPGKLLWGWECKMALFGLLSFPEHFWSPSVANLNFWLLAGDSGINNFFFPEKQRMDFNLLSMQYPGGDSLLKLCFWLLQSLGTQGCKPLVPEAGDKGGCPVWTQHIHQLSWDSGAGRHYTHLWDLARQSEKQSWHLPASPSWRGSLVPATPADALRLEMSLLIQAPFTYSLGTFQTAVFALVPGADVCAQTL